MKMIRQGVYLAFGLLTAFVQTTANGQGVPISGTAQVSVSTNPSQPIVGSDFLATVHVNLTGVTGKCGSSTVPAALSSFRIPINFDTSRFQFVGVDTSPQSCQPASFSINSPNTSTPGVVGIGGLASGTDPTGNACAFTLKFHALSLGTGNLSAPNVTDNSSFDLASGGHSYCATNSQTDVPGAGVSNQTTVVNTPPPPTCNPLSTPSLSGPSSASSGSSYTLSWTSVTDATGYEIEQATNSGFSGSTSSTVGSSTTSKTYNNSTCANTTFYYRVRAVRNVSSCNISSSESNVVTVAVSGGLTSLSAPVLTGPATAPTGTNYTLTWTAVAGATSYVIDESTNSSFTTPSSLTVGSSTLSETYNHNVCSDTTYYYRVRAVNNACSLVSAESNVVAVVVQGGTVVKPTSPNRIIVSTGSFPVSATASYKTSLQLYNASAAVETGSLIFHTMGVSGSSGDPSLPYSINPGQVLSYTDLIASMGQAGALGSVDLIPLTGDTPVGTARIYRDEGPVVAGVCGGGTTGFTEDLISPVDAMQPGDTFVLFAPVDTESRMNMAVRTLGSGVDATATINDATGAPIGTQHLVFPSTYFIQQSAQVFLGLASPLPPNATITLTINSGSAIFYAANVDNIANDPSAAFTVIHH